MKNRLIAGVLSAAMLSPALAGAATFTVSNLSDSGAGSLRDAITSANASADPTNTIDFSGLAAAANYTINLSTELPSITKSGTTVDGTTAPNFSADPIVQIDGATLGGSDSGLTVAANDCTITGLVITNFPNLGIQIDGSDNTVIQNNWIGVGLDGSTVAGNNTGIWALPGSDNTLIGTDGDGTNDAAEGNVISGNSISQIIINETLFASISNGTIIAGNIIGPSADLTTAITLTSSSVIDLRDCSNSRVGTNNDGTSDTEEANIIGVGGNSVSVIIDGEDSTGNIVAGNWFGTDPTETYTYPSTVGRCVSIGGGARNNMIGGPDAAQRNVMTNNHFGVRLSGGNTQTTLNNTVENNRIEGMTHTGISCTLTEQGTNDASDAPGDGPSDALIVDNLVDGCDTGMAFFGSSPTVHGNTISNSGEWAMRLGLSGFTATNGPDEVGDDYLSRPIIGGTGAGEPNTFQDNPRGIRCHDTVPDNLATLETDNSFTSSHFPATRVAWTGAIEVFDTLGNPVATTVRIEPAAFFSDSLTQGTSDCSGTFGGIIHTITASPSCDTAFTWDEIIQFESFDASTRQQYGPRTINGQVFSWDGDAGTEPLDTGAGYQDGYTLGPFSLNQVAEITVGSITIDDPSVNEPDSGSDTTVTFTLTRNGPLGSEVDVAWTTDDSLDASDGPDFTGDSGTATFGATSDTTAIVVTVNGDDDSESDEQFNITLSGPVNAIIGDATGTATIVDNDGTSVRDWKEIN